MFKRLSSYFYALIKYKGLIKELVVRDIKIRYRRSILGLLWTLLNPLLMMAVIAAVFSTIFKSDIKNFPVYYLSASVIFSFNSEATNMAMSSIIESGSLIKKVYIPKYLFPLSKVLSCLVNLFFAIIALIIVMVITKASFYPTSILFFIPIIYVFIFSLGLSLILSSNAVFFRDLIHLYSIFLTAWMYFTPLFYPIKIIPDKFMWIININPMYYYVEYFRNIVIYGQLPSFNLNFMCIVFSLTALLIGIITFYRKQDKFILYI